MSPERLDIVREIRRQHEYKTNNPNDRKAGWTTTSSSRPSIPNQEKNTSHLKNCITALAATLERRYDKFYTSLRATAQTDFEHNGVNKCLSAHRACK
ncbi:hypothetical protein PDIDSM_7099 [Penicillium digitatum]|nr:hypothetical protein PDIDSM_7099 [Penicillium digitatum]